MVYVYMFVLVLLISGCMGEHLEPALPDPQTVFVPDLSVSPPADPSPSLITLPSPPPLPYSPRPTPHFPKKGTKAVTPEGVIKDAQAESYVQPSREGYFGGSAIQRYVYQVGRIYELVTSPTATSLIILPPGERLAAAPAVNPEEWDLAAVESGSDETRQETVQVHPYKAGLSTRVPLICQSGRAYFVQMRSTESVSMAAITWELPVVAVQASHREGSQGSRRSPLVGIDRVHTAYTIRAEKGSPAWVPLSVWDDGAQTVVQFRQSLRYTAAPAVFAVGTDGKPEMVQVTPYNDGNPDHAEYYMIGGIYPKLGLRDGHGNEVVITRQTGRAAPYRAVEK